MSYVDEYTLQAVARTSAHFAVKLAGVAEIKKEIATRGANPAKWLGRGWETFSDGAAKDQRLTRGWTGSGKLTKYLPVGAKSLTLGFGAMTAPAAFAEEDITGQGKSRKQRIGGWIGSNIGAIAGSMPAKAGLLGLVPSMGGMLGGQYVGEAIGRAVD